MKIKSLLVVAVLAVIILCSAGAANATDNSALIAQLQAQIASLMAQIQAIRAQQSTTASWCYTFTRNLGYSNSGLADVGYLHTALTKDGFTYIGDEGNEYGEPTMEAIIKFQAKYGITQTGYVGTLTRTKINSLFGCGIVPTSLTPTVKFNASNASGQVFDTDIISVQVGSDINFVYSSTNATSCYAYVDSVLMNSTPPDFNQGATTGHWETLARTAGFTATYKVTCSNASGQQASKSITLKSLSTQSTIKIISPVAGSTITSKTLAVNGTCSNYSGSMNVYYYSDKKEDKQINCINGVWSTILSINSNAASGSFDLYAQAMGDASAFDKVNIKFNWSSVTPSITVISPNGGENWIKGQSHTITWHGINYPSSGYVALFLQSSSGNSIGVIKNIFFSSGNPIVNESFSWDTNTLTSIGQDSSGTSYSTDFSTGSYKIRASIIDYAASYGSMASMDESNSYFTITAPITQPTITSITPTQGLAGTMVTIYGTNLSGATTVEFYSTEGQMMGSFAPSYSYISSTSLTFPINWLFAANMTPGFYQVGVVANTCAGGCNSNRIGFTLTASTTTKINGICGSANGTTSPLILTANLCSVGTATSVVNNSNNNSWTWSCLGVNGGSSASCSATNSSVNGTCGTAAKTYSSTDTALSGTMCATGTVSGTPDFPVPGSFTIWTCFGYGGTNSVCTAKRSVIETSAVNGSCGSAARVYSSAATVYIGTMCLSGTVNPISPAFPSVNSSATWTCKGSNGGSDVSCLAYNFSTGSRTCSYNIASYPSIDRLIAEANAQNGIDSSRVISKSVISIGLYTTSIGGSYLTDCPVGSGYDECVSNTNDGGACSVVIGLNCLNDNCKSTTSPVDGVCGSAARAFSTSTTSFSCNCKLCATGTADPTSPSFPAIGSFTTWVCKGLNGGKDVKCTATR